jgi:hypothetical protein
MCEATDVPLEHLHPGEQVVPERDWLCPLQMGVARKERVGLSLGEVEHGLGEPRDAGASLGAGVRDVEAEGGRDLVVPRPPGVDLPPHGPEQALERGVDVLVPGQEPRPLLPDVPEPRLHLLQLGGVEQPRLPEPARVHQRRLAVVREQLGVVGPQELGDLRRKRALDTRRPQRHTAAPLRPRAAASSASSAAI